MVKIDIKCKYNVNIILASVIVRLKVLNDRAARSNEELIKSKVVLEFVNLPLYFYSFLRNRNTFPIYFAYQTSMC